MDLCSLNEIIYILMMQACIQRYECEFSIIEFQIPCMSVAAEMHGKDTKSAHFERWHAL